MLRGATPRRADITIGLGADLSAQQLELLEVASACPVRRSIETAFEFIEHTVPAGADLVVSA